MATWRELSLECQKAAKNLLRGPEQDQCPRSSINRSYYAAYAALAGKLEGKVVYKEGRENPSHAYLPAYILHNMNSLSPDARQILKKAIGRLWKARVNADYIPANYSDREMALNSLRDANTVLDALEIDHE